MRLVQEAHKRKLSAVFWVLLLREQGMQKNKPQLKTLASQRPAQPLQHSSVCAGLLPQVGMTWCSRPGDNHQHVAAPSVGVKLPYLTESNKKAVGSTEGGCHGCVLLPHQSISSFSRPLYYHRQTAWRCTAELCDRTSRLQSGGLQIMKSYTLRTSARPHDLGKKTHGLATVRNLFLG